MMECTKEQANDFLKEMDGLQKNFEKKLQVHGEALTKAVVTINSSISENDNHLIKRIDKVETKVVVEAVGTTEEIAAAAANTKVMFFATTHLKRYVSKFFNSLLVDKDVASESEINALHK